jgi:hypothetical protein
MTLVCTNLCSPGSADDICGWEATVLPIIVQVVEISREQCARGEIISNELGDILTQFMSVPAAELTLPGS